MSTITPERIVELWPSLSAEARRKIIEIAETHAKREATLDLTQDEEQLLARARDDFKHGRTLSMDEFRADMDTFMAGLRRKAEPSS